MTANSYIKKGQVTTDRNSKWGMRGWRQWERVTAHGNIKKGASERKVGAGKKLGGR